MVLKASCMDHHSSICALKADRGPYALPPDLGQQSMQADMPQQAAETPEEEEEYDPYAPLDPHAAGSLPIKPFKKGRKPTRRKRPKQADLTELEDLGRHPAYVLLSAAAVLLVHDAPGVAWMSKTYRPGWKSCIKALPAGLSGALLKCHERSNAHQKPDTSWSGG